MEFQNGAKTLFFRFFHFCVGGNDVGGNCVGGNEREFFSAHFGTHMGFQNGVQIRFKLFLYYLHSK